MYRDLKLPGNVIVNSGYCGCDERMAILKSQVMPRHLDDIEGIEEIDNTGYVSDSAYIYVDDGGKDKKLPLKKYFYPDHVWPDWNAEAITDSEGKIIEVPMNYIYNKPNMIINSDTKVETTVGSLVEGTVIDKNSTALDIILQMIGKQEFVEIKYGTWNQLPIMFDENTKTVRVTKKFLLDEGFDYIPEFSSEGFEEGTYPFLAIPKAAKLKCNRLIQGGHEIDEHEGLCQDSDSYWYIYHLNTPSDRPYPRRYKFIVNDVVEDVDDPLHLVLTIPSIEDIYSELLEEERHRIDADQEINTRIESLQSTIHSHDNLYELKQLNSSDINNIKGLSTPESPGTYSFIVEVDSAGKPSFVWRRI